MQNDKCYLGFMTEENYVRQARGLRRRTKEK